jgi:hypothetical protein
MQYHSRTTGKPICSSKWARWNTRNTGISQPPAAALCP